MSLFRILAPTLSAVLLATLTFAAGDSADPTLTRLVFQDHAARVLRWADVRLPAKDKFAIGPITEVAGFPKLDPKKQTLVQMRESKGLVLVGVRDNDDGAHQSGWVLLHAGATYADHGDHGHWRYKRKPEVWDQRLDAKQGNPAHLYLYDGRFFLANDALNGYTRLDPSDYRKSKAGELTRGTPRFLTGGGNHITLAVVDDKVGYSCWIDGSGPNKGRVDVTPIHGGAKGEPAYSFHLPTGVIHGAISACGKVFFAPADGVCWVEADLHAKKKPAEVQVHHLSLGKDGDKPRRTGAFESHGKYVLLVTGKGPGSELVLIDAKAKEPTMTTVALDVQKGSAALTPRVAQTREGKVYAFVFHDHAKDVDVKDLLEVIDLDPNGDGEYKDAKVVKRMEVGKSAVEGHFGHHDLDFDADRRYGFFTNPGDGTITVLSLKTLEPVATFPVGGMPTALVVRGGAETED